MMNARLLLLACVVGHTVVAAGDSLEDFLEDYYNYHADYEEIPTTENPWNSYEEGDSKKWLLESVEGDKTNSQEMGKSAESNNIDENVSGSGSEYSLGLSRRKKSYQSRKQIVTKCKTDPCNVKVNEEKQPWPLDSGKVPLSLLGGGTNDGLEGIAVVRNRRKDGFSGISINNGKGQAEPLVLDSGRIPENLLKDEKNRLQGGETSDDGRTAIPEDPDSPAAATSKARVPFYEIFGASAIPDPEDAESKTPFGLDDEGESSGNNQSGSLLDPTPPGDSFDTSNPPASSNEPNGLPPPEVGLPSSSDDEGGFSTSFCNCVPTTECGATFRSDSSSVAEGEQCQNGDVFCCNLPPIVSLPSDSITVPPVTLGCGQSRLVPNVTFGSQSEPVAEFAEFPWTVLLTTGVNISNSEDNGLWGYRCGGSLIHSRVVLTAAHCLDHIDVTSLIIRAGDWDLERDLFEPLGIQSRTVESVTAHPAYRTGRPPNDIALIKLNESFVMADNVNTVCLPSIDSADELDETLCVATGWGRSPSRVQQEVMKKIPMPIVPRNSCQSALRKTRLGQFFRLDQSFICAGGEEGKDVCEGDGGGPLVCPSKTNGAMVQTGVVSWGIECGNPNVPGVFSDVKKLGGWIEQTLASLVS